MRELSLKIAHFYPHHLNLYGDMGNILALHEIAKARNIDIIYQTIDIDSPVESLRDFDIFFMGGGQDHEQKSIFEDFLFYKGPQLLHELENNKVFLGICGGYQLLGNNFITVDQKLINGLAFFPIETRGQKQRLVGDLICEVNFLENKDRFLIGFENHSGITRGLSLEPNLDANMSDSNFLAKVLLGNGNNGIDKTEGWKKKNAFGTYCHGSFLPKNPAMTNYLLNKALENKYEKVFQEQYIDKRAQQLRDSFLRAKLGDYYA